HRQLPAHGPRAQPLVLLYRLPLLRGRRGAAGQGHLPRRQGSAALEMALSRQPLDDDGAAQRSAASTISA
ncbi:MAG: hypothetical protein M3380_01225, partial [Chloroflexota bacterium]|nr:hypothetical protein [Chloroflexota bacterium]